jgi:ABC-type transport system involved in cytochrome c biogenesis permease subunit
MEHAIKRIELTGAVDKRVSRASGPIPVVALGLSLSLFFALSFVLCVFSYLVAPTWPISHAMLAMMLPGFALLSISSFILGFIESVVWGWYIALIFGPLYNFFAARVR